MQSSTLTPFKSKKKHLKFTFCEEINMCVFVVSKATSHFALLSCQKLSVTAGYNDFKVIKSAKKSTVEKKWAKSYDIENGIC